MEPLKLLNILLFYADSGVHEPVTEIGHNYFLDSTPKSANPNNIPFDNKNALDSEKESKKEARLEELRKVIEACNSCHLKITAKNLVFFDGTPESSIMFIGETPGREEDIEGTPFVGKGGQLLNRMLIAIALERNKTYLTNIIPWRPPGNRPPTSLEIEICKPFIQKQIEIVQPKIIVTLGDLATKTLLNTNKGILSMRGFWQTYSTESGQKIATMPTFHPTYLLGNPSHKKLIWKDFLEIKQKLNQ